MTQQRRPYSILHQTIITPTTAYDERASSSLIEMELEMRPLGTQLEKPVQLRELVVRIGASTIILDESGIVAIKEFLDMRP